MTYLERLNEALKKAFIEKGIYKKGDMAEFLGYNSPYFSGIINGKEKISDHFLKIISEKLEINIEWLNTGKGEMFKNVNTGPTIRSYINTLDPGVINDPLKMSEISLNKPYEIPLIPVAAHGGSLNDFVTSIKSLDCEKIISPICNADFAITVAGDSMAPEYPCGSQVLIKKINEGAFIDWGKVYVLDTCNGSVIKKIMPTDKYDENKVKCVSINPAYPPFEMLMSDIYGMYKVMMCMAIK